MAQSKMQGTLWVGSSASSQQLPGPENTIAAEMLTDATIRQVVHLSTGGAELRVHLSNGDVGVITMGVSV